MEGRADMRHATEREIDLSADYHTVVDSCIDAVESVTLGMLYPEFALEYANPRSGRMRAVSSMSSAYIFVAEIAIMREEGFLHRTLQRGRRRNITK
jgi:hypothetical protein